MASKKYDDLSKDELIRLLEARDRRDATRFGLVWEANEIERDKALNKDFVALDLDPSLCRSIFHRTIEKWFNAGYTRAGGIPFFSRSFGHGRSRYSCFAFHLGLRFAGV